MTALTCPILGADTLLPSHLARFATFGLTVDLLDGFGVYHVSHDEARDRLGVTYKSDHLEGIVYPHVHPITGLVGTSRLRRDHPEIGSDGKPIAKYLAPPNDHRHLYFPAGVAALLADTTCPVVFVEAQSSALTICAAARRRRRPMLPIATSGCWGWRGVTGKVTDASGARVDERGPLSDLDLVTWTGRDTIIAFDSNATKDQVRAALRAFTAELARRGASVRIAVVPAEDGINGPDDFRAKHGDESLFRLIDEAKPVQPENAQDVLRLAGLDTIEGLTLADLEPRLHMLHDLLVGADAIRRRTVREILILTLKAAKIGGAAALVDAAIGTGEPDASDDPTTGFLADDAPWPEAVDGSTLLDALAGQVARYVVLPSPSATHGLALWIVLTYFDAVVNLLPLLLVTSPTKRCGKTKTVEVAGGLACRALSVSNITAAALYRTIDKFHPTLLLDEADTFFNDDPELRGVINAGHTRHTAQVIRCVGDDADPTPFSTWCPKLVAMIGTPKDTIIDRSIVINLERKAPGETVAQLRADRVHLVFADLRRQIRRFADDHLDTMRAADPTMPKGLHDRALDNWRPMVAIADLAGGAWPTLAREAAIALSGGPGNDDSLTTLLLSDIREVFGERENLSSKLLADSLAAIEARPWATWGKHEKPITQNALARQLRPFGVEPRAMRLSGPERAPGQAELVKGYARTDLDAAFSRYLPDSNRNTVTEPGNIDDSTDSNRNTPNSTVTVENDDPTNKTGPCYGVTVARAGDQREAEGERVAGHPDLLWHDVEGPQAEEGNDAELFG